jgi:hypothetical protein
MEWSPNLGIYPRYWHNRLKRGFGLGVTTYHPWLRVRDVPSIGTAGNPKGITIPRVYHLLSVPERIFFHLLDRQLDVVDIREQFPILHLQETLAICSELGVKHMRRGSYPEPFTLDFVVTRQTPSGLVYQARSIKTPEDTDVRGSRDEKGVGKPHRGIKALLAFSQRGSGKLDPSGEAL